MALSEEDALMLEQLCVVLGKSRAAFVRDCIRQAYASLTPERRKQLVKLQAARDALR